MAALILDGKKVAAEIEQQLSQQLQTYKKKHPQFTPRLATILVGDDPASATYVAMKARACARIGMESKFVKMGQHTITDELLAEIAELNRDDTIHGILLQHPVPKQIDERACFDAIALNKDVDGVTSLGFGKMAMDENVFQSATPRGIMLLLEHYQIPLKGKHAVVVGRSPILGKPMAMMLLNANATVTICHSHTKNLDKYIFDADIVIGAVGKPKFIASTWIKPGSIVIDAGYHPGGIGDIDLQGIIERAYAYTPVPGGVGPMTIATLISQTLMSAAALL